MGKRGVGDLLDTMNLGGIGGQRAARPVCAAFGAAAVVATGLDVRVEARAEYDAASAFLSEQLAGRELSPDGRTVRVDSLNVMISSGIPFRSAVSSTR